MLLYIGEQGYENKSQDSTDPVPYSDPPFMKVNSSGNATFFHLYVFKLSNNHDEMKKRSCLAQFRPVLYMINSAQ